jgi:hypothetical protein
MKLLVQLFIDDVGQQHFVDAIQLTLSTFTLPNWPKQECRILFIWAFLKNQKYISTLDDQPNNNLLVEGIYNDYMNSNANPQNQPPELPVIDFTAMKFHYQILFARGI